MPNLQNTKRAEKNSVNTCGCLILLTEFRSFCLTVDFAQRFKVVLESLSKQFMCKKLPHRNGNFDVRTGLKQTGRTHCVEV